MFYWLGYRKFFGAKNPAPTQQTKLAFATRPAVGDGDEDVSAKENTDPDQGMFATGG